MRADIFALDTATRLEGPLMFLKRTVDVGLNEAVEVEDARGQVRLGRVVALDEDRLTIEVLEATAGLSLTGTRVRFLGEPLCFSLSLPPIAWKSMREVPENRRDTPSVYRKRSTSST